MRTILIPMFAAALMTSAESAASLKFVAVYVTEQMAQGGANLGPLPGAPRFDNLALCQAELRKKPPAPNRAIGWQCIPELPKGNDHVDMRIVGERRSPGVQYGGHADPRARCLGSAAIVIIVSAEALNIRS
jgi:hypothetical protein